MTDKTSLSYKDAGVDIDAGNALVDRIKGVVKKTRRPEVMGGLGGFGALCALPQKYREPVLVSGTDGVGTKLRLAMDLKRHDTIGIDLVAMCVNDLVVQGAEPLFFLDYDATGKLDVDTAASVISGIAEGCLQSGCALVGGETAEMPGMYHGDDYDVAGFCVGVVEKSEIIDGSKVADGDVLVALASSGPHSNGYSLVRKIIEVSGVDPQTTDLNGSPLADHLLAPTRIYVKSVLDLIANVEVHAIAHLTGGASGKTFRAFCRITPRRSSTSPPGNGQKCSTGCSRPVTSAAMKCTVPLTAASAWLSPCRQTSPTAPSRC